MNEATKLKAVKLLADAFLAIGECRRLVEGAMTYRQGVGASAYTVYPDEDAVQARVAALIDRVSPSDAEWFYGTLRRGDRA